MILSVSAFSPRGLSLTFPLSDDVSSGLVLNSIDGLLPVKANIVTSSFAYIDGEQFQSARREARDIKIDLSLHPDFEQNQTISLLRRQLYSIFMPKVNVRLVFTQDDGPEVEIQGYVETLDGDLFVKEQGISIGLRCPASDFIALEPTVIAGNTTPFSDQTPLEYDGSVDTGFTFVLPITRPITDLSIYHIPEDGSYHTLEVSYDFQTDDVLKIVTQQRFKEVTLTRNDVDTSILYAMSPFSDWISLQPGTNMMRVYTEGSPMPYELQYTPKYGGL